MKSQLTRLAIVGWLCLAACSSKAPPPAPDRPQDSPQPTSSKSLPKIVAFGDSLTAGYGLSLAEGYPALLQERLEADGYQCEVVNAGVSGETSAGGLRRIDWALKGDVRIVILELGANDILRGQPIGAMKKNLDQIIEKIKTKGATVLLAGMEAPTNSGPDYRRETRAAFAELARTHDVAFIPFLLEGVAGKTLLNRSDGIHPNADGTRVVADMVYRSLKPLLAKQGISPAAPTQ
jgi:acyl-CoA thioesterase-1